MVLPTVYLRLLRTSAAATTAIIATAAAMAMYSIIEGAASVLGGGATDGDEVTEAVGDAEIEGDVDGTDVEG